MAEKLIYSYETIFIIDSTLEPEALEAKKAKFVDITTKNGEIGEVEDWGKKRLAYEIQHMKEGFYYFIQFEADATCPAEVEKRIRIMDNVIRYLCIRKDA